MPNEASAPAVAASSDVASAGLSRGSPSNPAPRQAGAPFELLAQRLAIARSGSVAALGEIFESCRNYLLLVANHKLGNDLQAKIGASDVVQETFVQAQKIFHRFEGNENEQLLAWLTQILEHKLAHARRQYTGTQKRNVGREVSLEGEVGAVPSKAGEHIRRQATPSSIATGKEEQRRLQSALERLPDDMRRAVELRSLERRSFAYVGEQLERSAEAARKLWVRAIYRLRQLLDDDSNSNSPVHG
ncbi:MAG: sigma-70 family RNA polymerase sigma factor [Pirellulales bacterium]|nr:sigma-70 family RNA polymerase sigma factor [Pirellulales bacterium]